MVLKVGDVLVIDWIDSVFAVGWYSQEQASEYMPKAICQSIGYCVKETDEFITLALNRDLHCDNAPFGHFISIPKVAIKKKRKIKI